MHNAESALEILRAEPRSVTDKVLDVFTYKFCGQRFLMIKWTQPGVTLSRDTMLAISGIDGAVLKKVGLPAFTQLKERNLKLSEYTTGVEHDRKKKTPHTPVYTPARGENYMTTQMGETRNNDSRPHVADSSQTNQMVIQQILRTQDEMMTRMEELTEASNALVATRTLPTEINIEKRLETQEQTIHHLREQQDKTNQLLSEMLHQMGKPAERTGAAGSTSAFRSQVVKPGHTTPAATGGPKGTSARPK